MEPTHSPSVVVIDDNEDDVFVFNRLLKQSGVENTLQVILGGEEAIAFFTRVIEPRGGVDKPLCCFLDINMPGLTGFDVLNWIRKREALNDLPIIMLSSSDDPRDVEKAARLGAQCYITKHATPAILGDVVRRAATFNVVRVAESRGPFDAAFNLLAANG